MWTQHNPKVPFGVFALIPKGCFDTSNTIIKFVFRDFSLSQSINSACCFELLWAHTLIKIGENRENQIGA